jgi:hypothetical protein
MFVAMSFVLLFVMDWTQVSDRYGQPDFMDACEL